MIVTDIFDSPRSLQVCMPLFSNGVRAGFPSPADDHIESRLDLSELLTPNPTSTYFVRVEGDSMREGGIEHGDILVVDRSIKAKSGRIVIACIDNELTVKRLIKYNDGYILKAENARYAAIEIKEGQELQVFGVVTGLARTKL